MGLSEKKHMRKSVKMPVGLDHLLAFISGVVLTLLFLGLPDLANHYFLIVEGAEIAALLAPLCIGIIVPLLINNRYSEPISAGMGVSLIVLAGIVLCGLPFSIAADAAANAPCNLPGRECYGRGFGIATLVTFLYAVYGVLLIIPSALLTGWIIKRIKKSQAKRESRKKTQEQTPGEP